MRLGFETADAAALLILFVVTGGLTWILSRSNGSDERRLLAVSFLMHFVFSQVLLGLQLTLYTESDVWEYRANSAPLLELLRVDLLSYLPRVLAVIFHVQNDLLDVSAGPSSTISMAGTVAIGRLLTGDSFWGVFALSAYAAFLGKWGIYSVFRDELGNLSRRSVGLATMCVPSVVFWTSGIVKEAYAVVGLGALCYGARLLLRGRFAGLPGAFAGAVVVGIFKPYVLFPFAVGAAGWLIFERSKRARAHAPIYMLVGFFVGSLLVILLSALFPQFSPTNLAEQTSLQQSLGASAGGGSVYVIAGNDGSIGGQLAAAPVGLLTALARPFPWEARGFAPFIAAVETSVLTFLFLWALLKGKLAAIRAAFVVPAALFSVLFVLIGGMAIGLASTNFGTLSRYRVPIIPFYAVLVVHLSQHTAAARRAAVARRQSGFARAR